MAIVGDVIQLVTTIRITGATQNLVNVYWFRVITAGAGNACVGIEATFRLNTWPVLATILSDSFHLRSMELVNWRDPSEFLSEVYSQGALNGDIPGDYLPDWISYNFNYMKDRPGRRPGLKQLPGVPETCVLNGGIHPDYVDEVAAVETVLGGSFSSLGYTYLPVVVQRVLNGIDVFPALGTGTPQNWQPSRISCSGLGHRDSRR